MKKLISLSVSFFLVILTSINISAGLPTSALAQKGTTSIAPMLKKVMPCVVNISVRGEMPMVFNPFQEQHPLNPQGPDGLSPIPSPNNPNPEILRKFEDIGSGVVVDAKKGYVLTNAHVIKDAIAIVVTLDDGRRMRAKTIGYDIPSDIAVLQIQAKHLNQITFGDASKLSVGDFVAAIGSPFGLQKTVTSGVISGLERSNLGIEGYENFIQTDAPINPGNSGGALVNMDGELIGINTAIISPGLAGGNVGVGLAIPSNMAKSVMEQLIEYGKVSRGVLGVMVQNITPSLADAMHLPSTEGALVSEIVPGSPADKAGLKVKDMIISLNGNPIHSAFQISTNVGLLRTGSKVSMKILRNKKPLTIEATIMDPEELAKNIHTGPEQLLSGMQLKNFNQLVDNQQVKGVQILDVDDSSIAFSSGLRAGDIIITVNDKTVTTLEELQEKAKQNPDHLLLEIKRGTGGNIFLVLEQ